MIIIIIAHAYIVLNLKVSPEIALAHSLTVLYYLCAYNMRMLPKLQHLINVNKTRQNIVVLVIILS